mgnify:CR=1 FL=1
MDSEAILARARAAQLAQQTLEAFVQECFRLANEPAAGASRIGTMPHAPVTTVATRAGLDPRASFGRQNLTPAQPAPVSAAFYRALAGGVLRQDIPATRAAMSDFAVAVRTVWNPSLTRLMGLLLKQPVLVEGERDLIAYRVHFGSILGGLWGIDTPTLTRTALRLQGSRLSAGKAEKAAECSRVWGMVAAIATIMVATVVCVVAITVNSTTSIPGLFLAAVSVSDAVLVVTLTMLINESVMLVDIARAMMLIGINGLRLGSVLAAAWKAASPALAGTLNVMVAVLRYEVYGQGYQVAQALRNIATNLLQIQVQLDALVAALKSLQASEADIVAAMKLTWKKLRLVIEPSSAVPLATILKNPELFRGQRIGVIITGGNVDLDTLPWMKG